MRLALCANLTPFLPQAADWKPRGRASPLVAYCHIFPATLEPLLSTRLLVTNILEGRDRGFQCPYLVQHVSNHSRTRQRVDLDNELSCIALSVAKKLEVSGKVRLNL